MFKLDNLNDYVQFFKTFWFEKTGLVVVLIVTTVTTASLLIQGKATFGISILFLVLINLSVYLAWWISRIPPKTPKDKIGFLVSISCDNDTESKRLRDDFLIPLRNLIKSGNTESAFSFMELPQYLARTIIDKDDALSLRIWTRCHFMLYGRVRLRIIEGQEHHVIELDGMVAHKPVPEEVSQSLAREFSELLPRKLLLSTENDLLTFQFTSEWAAIVAKYIIGIAAACSGDLVYAELLYTDAHRQLLSKKSEFPIYKKLIERLPIRISELYEVRALMAHQRWVADHDPSHIEELGEYLKKSDKFRSEPEPNILNLRAIYVFIKDRDVDEAIRIMKKINAKNDGLWHCNMAFLLAYIGDLKGAIRHYRQAAKHLVPPEVIEQVEGFICWVHQDEPDKYQFTYCLGFFNWKVKGDKIQAKKDLTDFIDSCPEEEFIKERELAHKWLVELY